MKHIYYLLFFLLTYNSCLSQSKIIIDSLERNLQTCRVDTQRVILMMELSKHYRYSQPEMAWQYGFKSLQLANQLQFKSGSVKILLRLGNLHKQEGNYDSAHHYYELSLHSARSMKNARLMSASLNNMGDNHRLQGNYSQAIECLLQSLKIKEQIGDYSGFAYLYNGIGVVHYDQKDYDKAIKYYNDALAISQTTGDSSNISSALLNIGEVHEARNNLSLALDYYLQSLHIDQKTNDRHAALISFNHIAKLYLKEKNYPKALHNYNQSIEINRQINDQKESSISLIGLGKINYELKKFSLSIEYARRGLELARLIGAKPEIAEACEVLHQAYGGLGEFRNAYLYRGLYVQTKDSIFNQENSRRIAALQNSYELDKKQTEIALLNKDRELKQQEIKKQDMMLWAALAGACFVLLIAGILFDTNRKNQQKNALLTTQKQQIEDYVKKITAQQHNLQDILAKMEQQNQQLQDSEVELLKLNALKNKYFSVLSHDLRNSFASLKACLPLLRAHLQPRENTEVMQLLDSFKSNIYSVNSLLDNVLIWSLSQMNMMPAEPKKLSLHGIAQSNLGLIAPFAQANRILLSNLTDHGHFVLADENMLNSIFRNLLSNATKFTPQGGSIEISSRITGSQVEVRIRNTGEGISEQDLPKLFTLQKNHTTAKPGKGTGLGLLLCREFAEKNGGSIRAESVKNRETTFLFTMPVVQEQTF